MNLELIMLAVAVAIAAIAIAWIIRGITKKTDVYFRIDRSGNIVINEDCEKMLLKHSHEVDNFGNYRFTICDGKGILL